MNHLKWWLCIFYYEIQYALKYPKRYMHELHLFKKKLKYYYHLNSINGLFSFF